MSTLDEIRKYAQKLSESSSTKNVLDSRFADVDTMGEIRKYAQRLAEKPAAPAPIKKAPAMPAASMPKQSRPSSPYFTPNILNQNASQNNTLLGKATGDTVPVKKDFDFAGTEKRMDELADKIARMQNDPSTEAVRSKQTELLVYRTQYEGLKKDYEKAKADKWYADTGKEISDSIVTGNKGLYSDLKNVAGLSDIDMAERMAMNAPGVGSITTSVQDELNAAKAKLPAGVDADWLEYARHANEREAFDKSMEEARAYAEAHPVGSSVASVPLNLMSGAGGVDVLGKKLGKLITGSEAPINFQSAAMIPSAATQEIRSTVSKDMSATGSMLYNVGMSIADSAAIVGMSAFGVPGGSALLGSSAATSTMRAAAERGASENQAIALGLISGAAEAFFEKYSIDNLLTPNGARGAKAFFENFFKQGVTEMTEEGATTLANTAADFLIMGDKNELAQRKQRLIADGYSEEEANRIAGTEWVKNFGVDLLGGLISGGFFSTAKSAASGIFNATNKTDSRFDEMARDIDSIMPRLPQQQFASHQSAQDVAVGDIVNMVAAENNAALGQNENATAEEPKRVGQASILKNPYTGDTPTYTKPENRAKPVVTLGSVKTAADNIQKAKEIGAATGKSYRNSLTDMLERVFGNRAHAVKVNGTSFENEDYVVSVHKNALGKLVSDPNMSAEKLAVLDVLDEVISNGEYVGSNRYVPKGKKQKLTTRFDLFETPVSIEVQTEDGGTKAVDYIVTFDVEVFPNINNYRTHKVINEMDLTPVSNADTGSDQPQGSGKQDPSNPDIPQSGQSVNGEIDNMDANPAMGAADSGFDPYSHASIEHGAIPPGENPARVVDVPKSMDGESNVMQTVRTIMEADATPDAAIPELEQAIVDGKFSKMPITDQAASGRAESTIRQVGYQRALEDWRAEVRNGKVSKDSVAMGETLYNAAVNANDYKSAVKIAIELSAQVRSAAQALQAVRMLKKMSPAAQLYGVKQSVDNLQKTLTDKYGDRAPNLTVNEELAARFLEAETDADRKAAEEALYKDIAKQIPATFADKWNAWRYLSMLGNARTHVRNIAGNALFAPVRIAKNKLGAAMEAGAQAVGLIDQSQRTKSLTAAGKDLMSAARADYKNVEQQIMSAGKYNSASNIIDENRKIFKNVVLETLRQGNSKALEWEDSFFSKEAYASSLASYLKAQGFTAADFTGDGMTSQQKDAARAYAIKEAQKATYRDINGFSEAISSIGFKNPGNSKTKKALNAAIEGVMPFKKTPANILVRGMEYSPAGLLKALTVDITQVKNGKITAGEYMDHLASGLTGSGLFALGCLLSNMGLLVGGTPEDEEQADLEGRQAYALEVGGKSVTLDWLAPEAMPVFMGVELMEAIREGGGDASLTDKVLSFVRGLSGPMLEMSMMSSLQDALEATEYADDKLLAFMANGALGYLKQAQPTLFGQLERALESRVRKTTFTQEGDKYLNKDAQYMVGSVANKIPFLDYNQVPYIDAWGRTEDLGGTGERLFNNMLNPAYVSDIKETPVDKEIKRLEEVVGGNLTPSRADKVLTINSEKVILTADEYVTYAQAKGQNDMTFRQNLIDSDVYAGLDDTTKAKAMEKSKDLANVLAIKEAGFEPVMSDWQSELVNADAETITQTLIAKAVESQAGTTAEAKYTSYGDMLDAGTIDDQIALSLLPESTLSDYMEFAKPKNVPASALMDALAYMNSEDAKTKYNEKTGKAIKGEGRQDHMKEYIASLDLTRAQKGGLWCVFYEKSTCPEYWR